MLTLTINGSDFLPQYKTNSAKIKERVASKVNTLRLIITKKSGESIPQEGKEIILKDGSRYLFGGYITKVNPLEVGEGQMFIYEVEAADYSWILVNKNAQKSYASQTLEYIAEDLLSEYVDSGYSLNTDNIQTGPTINTIAFDHINLRKCFEKLAKVTGYEWWIGYDKKVYFQSKLYTAAAESITDSSNNFIDIGIQYDVSQVKNYIIIKGGKEETSSYFSQTFKGDGKAREWILREKPTTMEFIKLNTVSKNYGIDPLDEDTGNDFMFNYQEKYIRCTATTGTPGTGDEIEVSYKYQVPIIVSLKSATSIAAMKVIEGGDGIHAYSFKEPSIESKKEARQRALKILGEYADPLVIGEFRTRTGLLQAGTIFAPGQLLTVNLPTWNINSDTEYLIQEVNINLFGDGTNIEYNYSIKFGGKLTGVKEWLESLAGKEDVVLDTQEIDRIEAIAETMTIEETITKDGNARSVSESITIAEAITCTNVTPPFKWAPSATKEAVWDLFEWG